MCEYDNVGESMRQIATDLTNCGVRINGDEGYFQKN
jgi:hypothetical protein